MLENSLKMFKVQANDFLFFPSQTNLGINGTRWESHVFTAMFVGSDLGDLPRDLLSKVLMPGICNWTWRVKAGSSKMGWT